MWLRGALLLLLAGVASCGAAAPARQVPVHCDRFAAPGGSDRAAGTRRAPFRTPQRLSRALRRGQTGCLAGGTYRPWSRATGYVLRFGHGGVTIRGLPGQRVVLAGVVYVPRGADGVTLADLSVDDRSGSEQLSVQVDARRTVLRALDITNDATKTCIVLGNLSGYGVARDTVVRDDTIHDCGSPAHRLFDHALYVANARRARIVDNTISDAAGYAVHLYPNARDTVVRGNRITAGGGGILVGSDGGHVTSGSLIEDNVVAGAHADYDLAAYWGGRVGTGNVLRHNCLVRGPGGTIDPALGAAATANPVGDCDGPLKQLGASPSPPPGR